MSVLVQSEDKLEVVEEERALLEADLSAVLRDLVQDEAVLD